MPLTKSLLAGELTPKFIAIEPFISKEFEKAAIDRRLRYEMEQQNNVLAAQAIGASSKMCRRRSSSLRSTWNFKCAFSTRVSQANPIHLDINYFV